jgi:thiamine kinase-like enzyme
MRTTLALDERVAAALVRWGVRARNWTRISRHRGGPDTRVAYRLELGDGRALKARCCADEATARDIWQIHRHLSIPGLARLYARDGPVLLEEWVEGTPLPRADATPEHVVAAATILARLHGVELIGAAVARSMTAAERLAQARRDLALLAERGALPPGQVRTMRGVLGRLDPGVANIGVIHRDFCAENMVRGPDGRLCVIDNEGLAMGPLAYDLGRVWCRWPMPPAAWGLFLETYAAQRAQVLPDSGLVAWKLAATARSAALCLASDPGRLPEPLARLRELSEALEAAASPLGGPGTATGVSARRAGWPNSRAATAGPS